MSEHLQPIYDVWGGNAEAMAADIDELGVTVRQWRNRGDIPSRAWPKIIRAAAAKGKTLRLEDFLAPDVKSDLPLHGTEAKAEWPIQSANNGPEIIGSDHREREGGHGGPFLPSSPRSASPDAPRAPSPLHSSQTSSATLAPPPPLPASPASSDGKADAA